MGRKRLRNRCSHPNCDGEATADLIMKIRKIGLDGNVLLTSSYTAKLLYLCDEHWPGMIDFMEAYEGETADDKDIDG